MEEEIALLPRGYISRKTISGREYCYHQFSEGGKKRSVYIPNDQVDSLIEKLDKRRILQKELSRLRMREDGSEHPSFVDAFLMHQRVKVAEVRIERSSGRLLRIADVFSLDHLPLGVKFKKGKADRTDLSEWWEDRAIPWTRDGIEEALESIDRGESPLALLPSSYALSLSDQYWLCPKGREIDWNEINFFDNDFGKEVGQALFGKIASFKDLDMSSPDLTSGGNLRKRWEIIDGKRFLLKGGSAPFYQQPFNEVVATCLLRRLGIDHIPYTLTFEDGLPYSLCEDFVSRDADLVPAYRLMLAKKKPNDVSIYQHFLDCCEDLGIGGAKDFLNRMIVVDYLLLNEDRHLNNFGALRDARSLEWLGFAPIFDSGTSLHYDRIPSQMHFFGSTPSKPFKREHSQQLLLVDDFSWIDFGALDGIEDELEAIFHHPDSPDFLFEDRVEAIIHGIVLRLNRLRRMAEAKGGTIDDSRDDVEEDVAASYEKP